MRCVRRRGDVQAVGKLFDQPACDQSTMTTLPVIGGILAVQFQQQRRRKAIQQRLIGCANATRIFWVSSPPLPL